MSANPMNRQRRRCEEAKAYFRNCVQQAREARGWSQAELAERVGCSPSVISRIETGPRAPTGDQLFMLCDVLNLSNTKAAKESETRDKNAKKDVFPLSRDLMLALIKVKFEQSDKKVSDALRTINLDGQDDDAIRTMFHRLWGDEIVQQGGG